VTVALRFIFANAVLCHISKSCLVIGADKVRLRALLSHVNPLKTYRVIVEDKIGRVETV